MPRKAEEAVADRRLGRRGKEREVLREESDRKL